jgi:hypothetical protein
MIKKSISLAFMVFSISLFFFWVVAFLGIGSFDFILKNFNYFKVINWGILVVGLVILILGFKLNLEKCFSRYREGYPIPNPDRFFLVFGVELLVAIVLCGILYTHILNAKGEEITQINLLRLYDISYLIFANYFCFIVGYLSFRYFGFISKK